MKRQPLRQWHFSGVLLLCAIVWALVSVSVFSQFAVHALHDTQAIDLGFPGSPESWVVKGDPTSFRVCEEQLCIRSASAARASLVMLIPVERQLLNDADHFLVDYVANAWSESEYTALDGSPSVFFLAPLGKDETRYRSLPPMVFLEEGQARQHYRGSAPIREGVEALRFIVVVRSTGAWVVESLQLHTVKYSAFYKSLRRLVFIGWFSLLLLLTVRVQPVATVPIKLLRGAVFGGLVFAGAGTLGPIVMAAMSKAWALSTMHGYSLNLGGSWQVYSHVSLHLLITLYFCWVCHSLRLSIPRIVALNLTVAFAIECVQMGVPGRAAEVTDVGLALLGMSLALLLFYGTRAVKNQLNTQPN